MTHQQTILIVDDDLHILEVLEARLSSAGFCVLKAASPKEALNLLKTHHPDLMISDMKMPDMSGMSLLTEVHSLHPGLPVIFLTAYGTIPDAVRAVKAGAVEYFTKPFDGRELIKKVQDVLKANAIPKKTVSTGHGFYLGQSRAMKELYEMIERVAASDVNVLVLGESGVGKERVARLIHDQGVRKDYPFVVVDCGSTPTGLLESELFGHVKGSFTHAIRDKKGLMEAAHTGTLFLDEIGNISSEMQVRLLRFLEDRKIRRIGDIREISVDCRVIAATNSNLADEIREGNFREDLYYRLRVVSLTIPPLRERKEDIPAFAQNFAEAFCKSKGIAPIKLLPETIEYLCRYRWPGNVRELKNALEGGIVLSQNGVLRSEDLQLARISENPKSPENPFSLDDSERDTIVRALRESGGVQKDAADLLGISRRAIHYKIKKYGIKISDIRANGR